MTLQEIQEAQKKGKEMKWNDPDHIEGNDYTITYIEDLTQFESWDKAELEDCFITIQYGGGSEAEVYLSEITLS